MSAVKLMNYVTNKVAVAVGSNGGGFSLYELDASLKSRFEVPRSQPRLLSPSRVGWPASVKVTRNQNWDDFAAKGYRLAGLYGAIGASDAVIEERLQRLANGMEPTPGGYSPGYLLAYACNWTIWCRSGAPDNGRLPYIVESKSLNTTIYKIPNNARVLAFSDTGREAKALAGNPENGHGATNTVLINFVFNKDGFSFSNYDLIIFSYHMHNVGEGREALRLSTLSDMDSSFLETNHPVWAKIAEAFRGVDKRVVLNSFFSDDYARKIVAQYGINVVAPGGQTRLEIDWYDGTRGLHIHDRHKAGFMWTLYGVKI